MLDHVIISCLYVLQSVNFLSLKSLIKRQTQACSLLMLKCVLNCVLSGDTECSLDVAATALCGFTVTKNQFWSLLATGVVLIVALGIGVGRRTAINVDSSRSGATGASDAARRQALLCSGEDRFKVVRSNADWSGGSWDDLGPSISR